MLPCHREDYNVTFLRNVVRIIFHIVEIRDIQVVLIRPSWYKNHILASSIQCSQNVPSCPPMTFLKCMGVNVSHAGSTLRHVIEFQMRFKRIAIAMKQYAIRLMIFRDFFILKYSFCLQTFPFCYIVFRYSKD